MLDSIKKMSLIFVLVGLVVWVLSYMSYAFLLMSSERIATRIRVKYLESLLKQESAWYDIINPSELSARLGKETQSIQKALGEKMSTIILSFSMTISGLAISFSKGWSYSLILLIGFPFLTVIVSFMSKVLQAGYFENMKAYG